MDPISDMFIQIKNACNAGHEAVQISYSQFKQEIIKALERSGLIGESTKKGKRIKRFIEIPLRAKSGTHSITHVRLISKPSRRVYAKAKEMKSSNHGGVVLVSTPKGVMTSVEARNAKVGGQLIAEVW